MIDLCVCDAENKLYENHLIGINDKVIFVTENCAVTECFDNGHFTYYAVNLNSLKKKCLSKRKNKITEEFYEHFAQKTEKLDINKSDMTMKTTRYDRANNLLRHIFSYILPTEGFSFRKNQLDLATEMLSGLETKNVALMEAEVGTGKTHAYIIAVIIYNLFHDVNSTTLISTSTIALQKAITEEYIPQISDILMKHRIIRKPLDFAVRKGKSHYICDIKLKTYLSSLEKNKSQRDETLIKTLKKLSLVSEREIDLDTYPLTRYVKDRICVTNKCNELCSRYDTCRFINFTNGCLYHKYYFQIANHNYVFADIRSYRPLLPKYKVIVFDEAHKLYDVAKQMYGCYLSTAEFAELITYIEGCNAKGLNEFCNLINNDYTRLFRRIAGNPDMTEHFSERRDLDIDDYCICYIKNIIETLECVADTVYDCDEIKIHIKKRRIRKMALNIKNKLEIFLAPQQLVTWYEYNNNVYRLCAIPKDLSKQIYTNLWNREALSVLTSGTLSANGDFGLMKNKLGIDYMYSDKIAETSKKSPFDYKQNALIYIPEYIPFPNVKREGYIKAVTNEIDRLLKATYGHSLVLFTSYRLMEIVFNNISKNKYDYPFFIMGRGRVDALCDFKISENGVLFASDAAGEGVDIVGDTLSNLIIVKLPFAVPDPLSKYEQSVMGGLDNYLKNVNTPNMIIKLKQYVGRLIRSEYDTGVVAILDSRVNSTGKYRNIVLESLFDAEVTNNITSVERFIMEKKKPDYFE
jgi:ATP-dependent DNA helicase DinG